MQLSTKGRYAVMALADLAKEGEGSVVPLATISGRQNISLPYLEQLFLKMRRGGIVSSMRGPGGGYTLARPAADIRIIEIMKAVDEPVKMTRCTGDAETGCVGDHRCLTHDLWDALGEQIISFLDGVSLGDVVENALAKETAKARAAKSQITQRAGNDHAGTKR
jgi:Rrf2 family iron-sulfur cluster assembly transcriptional regulator